MRGYFFGNYYLSSIQQGIQAAHCTADMAMKYSSHRGEDLESWQTYCDWAQHHKTMVLLNGGNQASLNELAWFFNSVDNIFPWEQFFEDEQSLNGCLTCVGIILPERIYEAAVLIRSRTTEILKVKNEETDCVWISSTETEFTLSPWEYELIQRMNQCGLAK